MKCELVFVGTELLLGDILNTNAQYLSKKLAALGFEPSPEMGRVLNTLLDEVMEEKLENTKDSLINRAMQLKSR